MPNLTLCPALHSGSGLFISKIGAAGPIFCFALVHSDTCFGQPCVIIPPWHPERMKALAVKTRRVAGLASHLLAGVDVRFGDHGIFTKEFSEELRHPFYPEIAIAERAGVSELVTESATVNGYSLMEMPVGTEQEFLTDVDPTAAARQVKELLDRYVGLQPHEASNLSVLLYNADAAELPLAVVHELSRVQAEREDDFQCAVAVRHRDPEKLRRVYAELVTKAGEDPDLPVVSETSENFVSKLRIAAVPTSSTPSSSAGFRPFDIAFLHDVVSRTAGIEWIKVPWSNERPDFEHAPSRWSYRSVSGEDELKSTTFLTCPQQTSTGWAYVAAVGSIARRADLVDGERLLPARRISLESPALKDTIDDAHAMAEWVADLLLDAHIPPGASNLLERARARLRSGEAPISLRGYSHVFVHSPDPASPGSLAEQSPIESSDDAPAWQEVFDRQQLRALMETYAGKGDSAAIRATLGPQTPWLGDHVRLPAPRVTWTSMIGLLGQPLASASATGNADAVTGATATDAPSPAPVTTRESGSMAPPTEAASTPVIPVLQTASAPPSHQSDSGDNLAALVAERSQAANGTQDERAAWAEEVAAKLRVALNGYGLQAAVKGTRLTPNGCLVKLAGSDRLAAKLTGEQGLVFAQAPFLSEAEIAAAVNAIAKDAS